MTNWKNGNFTRYVMYVCACVIITSVGNAVSVKESCRDKEFLCENSQQCVPKAWLCDGDNDCSDGSDETMRFCDDKHASCSTQSHFNCTKDGFCIPKSRLCDGKEDCSDGIDEGRQCEIYNSITGCGSGYVFCNGRCTSKNILCNGIADCDDKIDEYNCSDKVLPKLLFSVGRSIYMSDINGKSVKDLYRQGGLINAIDFIKSDSGSRIYWHDHMKNRIYSGRMTESTIDDIRVLFSEGLSAVQDIAVDWICENLYWLNTGMRKIEVSTLNGTFRKTLIDDQLSYPTSIALDPLEGLMFWSDRHRSSPRISRAAMDGTRRKVIVLATRFLRSSRDINGLTLDVNKKALYWIDAVADTLSKVDYDGNNYQLLVRSYVIGNPSSVVGYNRYFYWNDRSRRLIPRFNFEEFSIQPVFTEPEANVYSVDVFHSSRQPQLNEPNPCHNRGNCSHLCLLKPGLGRTCSCQNSYSLSNDNTSCIDASHCDVIRMQNYSASDVESLKNISCFHHPCVNALCAEICVVLDNHTANCNCPPGYVLNSDHKTCTANCSVRSEFQCYDGSCISKSLLCNGYPDCEDGSDESECSSVISCTENEFKCASGRCVSIIWVCDGENDCGDFSDEQQNCTSRCISGQYRCSSGRCIPLRWVCDGEQDCQDNSDENVNCTKGLCTENQFKCSASNRCIPSEWICDGDQDCPDGSDENGSCGQTKNCSDAQFICNNGNCVNDSVVCDGNYDCSDSSDESDCRQKLDNSTTPDILYSTGDSIIAYSIISNQSTTALSGVSSVAALAFNPKNKAVFWSSLDNHKIYRGKLNGSIISDVKIIVERSRPFVEDIAVDWLSDNLYWVDSKRSVIEVSTLNGSFRHTLIKSKLERPRSLSLDVSRGLMFWTDWSESKPRINKAWMTGDEIQTVIFTRRVDGTGGYPNGLALDETLQMIYWADAMSHTINRVNYDGTAYKRLGNDVKMIFRPLYLTRSNHTLYWSDWEGIRKLESGKMETVLAHPDNRIFDIVAVSNNENVSSNETDACENNGDCDQLCLRGFGSSKRCVCQNGFTISANTMLCEPSSSCNMIMPYMC